MSENKFCVDQRQVEDKSNEITAIPELLDSIDITGSIVTTDAIGTQRKTAAQIRSKEAHCLLSVKSKQQELLDDMECAFKTYKDYDYYEEPDCGHDRIETRKCAILRAKKYLLEESLLAWKDVSKLVKVESIRDVNGVQSKNVRYFISDEQMNKARYYIALARDHWSIENSLHWCLDVTFKEDVCKTRTGHVPTNLFVIRIFAPQLIAKQKDELNLKKRLHKAALDIEYLKKIIRF